MEIPETLQTSSTHAFKGKEADVVIVWDGDAGSYPLVHPDWVFNRIFGTSLEDVIAEEQRLAYVAVTRAREHLFIISDGPASPLFNAGKIGINYMPPRLPENLVLSPRTENPETKSNT
jgi:DNA helicase-4